MGNLKGYALSASANSLASARQASTVSAVQLCFISTGLPTTVSFSFSVMLSMVLVAAPAHVNDPRRANTLPPTPRSASDLSRESMRGKTEPL